MSSVRLQVSLGACAFVFSVNVVVTSSQYCVQLMGRLFCRTAISYEGYWK